VSEQDAPVGQEAPSQAPPLKTTLQKRRLAWILGSLAAAVALILVVAVLVATPRDSDGDGLPDLVEESGWRTSDGVVYVSDPHEVDTDGDGLSDSEEAGEVVSKSSEGTIYAGLSDPTKIDSDEDGLDDKIELHGWLTTAGASFRTEPMNADTDGDGLSDGDEAGAIVDSSAAVPVFDIHSDPTKADSDEDGLDDEAESLGWPTVRGAVYATDPMNADTDGDGLADGEEAGHLIIEVASAAYNAISSPLLEDSDSDGLTDLDEYDLGTNLWQRDTDGDGLSDHDELVTHNTDPRNRDSDDDGYDDGFELAHSADGFAMLEPHNPPDPRQWVEDFYVGAVGGEFNQRDSIAWLAGNVSQGGTIFIPGVGEVVGLVGDFRDSLAQALRGEYADAAWSAVGLVPVIGLTAITPKVVKFVKRLPNLRPQVDTWVDSLDVPAGWRLSLRKAVWGSDWDKLASRGFTDEALERMLSSQRANLMDEVQERPSSIGPPAPAISGGSRPTIGANGEAVHAARLAAAGATNIETQVTFDVPPSCTVACGLTSTRRLDVCSGPAGELSCAEVKAGYTPAGAHVLEEIARDVELLKAGKPTSITYHFYWSAGSGSVGAHPKVLELLREHNITYEIHPPS
jgi:hypothetical protein